MTNPINVLVTVPDRNDQRTDEERAHTLAEFRALDERLRFTFIEYLAGQHTRQFVAAGAGADETVDLTPEFREALAKAEVMLAIDLPPNVHLLAPKLRWVQSFGAGVAQFQQSGLDKLDAKLTNAAGVTADSIAEFALARVLSHWKIFATYRRLQSERRWEMTFGRSLSGSTIGIVGFGAIGKAVAWRAKAWGMHVLVVRQRASAQSPDSPVDQVYAADRLKEMLERCDAVVLCAAESPQTYHMFDAEAFAAMKSGSYFCNVARGSLVDEDALRHALANGPLAAASIDVAEVEPLPSNSLLWDVPNLEISPHSSPALDRMHANVWKLFYENMRRYLAGEEMINLRSTQYVPD